MAIQLSIVARNSMLDQFEVAVSTSAILSIKTLAQPASCAAAETGSVLAVLQLPSDWLAAATGGSKALTGTWTTTSASITGTASHFRLYASDGTTCHMQGTVTATGAGGDLTLDNTSVATGQSVTITSFSITAGNA